MLPTTTRRRTRPDRHARACGQAVAPLLQPLQRPQTAAVGGPDQQQVHTVPIAEIRRRAAAAVDRSADARRRRTSSIPLVRLLDECIEPLMRLGIDVAFQTENSSRGPRKNCAPAFRRVRANATLIGSSIALGGNSRIRVRASSTRFARRRAGDFGSHREDFAFRMYSVAGSARWPRSARRRRSCHEGKEKGPQTTHQRVTSGSAAGAAVNGIARISLHLFLDVPRRREAADGAPAESTAMCSRNTYSTIASLIDGSRARGR